MMATEAISTDVFCARSRSITIGFVNMASSTSSCSSSGRRRLIARDAWTVGEQDPELICIDPDDDPIVPAHVADPPIAGALEFLRDRKKHPGKG